MRRVVLFALVCLFVLLFNSRPANAVILDLTTVGAWGEINGAVFQQFSQGAGGSGNIDAFVRIQASGIQQGYNTDGRPVEFDEDTSTTFNHSVLLSSIPTVSNNGTTYREFLLDINQSQEVVLSMDMLQIAMHTTGNLLGYSSIFSSPIYDLDDNEDSWILIDYSVNSGSGSGDMLAYIPDDLFTGPGEYVYLYSKFGVNSNPDDGFEEWAHGVGAPVIPEPTTISLLALGILALRRRRRA